MPRWNKHAHIYLSAFTANVENVEWVEYVLYCWERENQILNAQTKPRFIESERLGELDR